MDKINQLIKERKRFPSTDVQILLRQIYETSHGIYNHEGPEGNHPFALVLATPSEDPMAGKRLRERAREYIDCEVHKYFHIDFNTFLEQYPWMCDYMVQEATRRIKQGEPEKDRIVKELENSLRN